MLRPYFDINLIRKITCAIAVLSGGVLALNTPLYSKEMKQDHIEVITKELPFSPGLKVKDKSTLTALYSIMSTYQILGGLILLFLVMKEN